MASEPCREIFSGGQLGFKPLFSKLAGPDSLHIKCSFTPVQREGIRLSKGNGWA